MVPPTMARIVFFQVSLVYLHFVVVSAGLLTGLSSSPTSEVNSTSFGVDPPRNIICAEDFGGLGGKPDYNECARAVSLLPRGTSA